MNSIKFFIALPVLATVFIASCNQDHKAAGNHTIKTDSLQSVAVEPVLEDKNTAEVYKHYIHLKDALVDSKLTEAQIAAKELAEDLKKIDGCETTAGIASNIASSSDLKKQRLEFIPLSSDIISLMKNTSISSGKLYVDYCPMANDGKGGYWLSSNSEIKNPYYGSEMLNCGEIKEVFEKK